MKTTIVPIIKLYFATMAIIAAPTLSNAATETRLLEPESGLEFSLNSHWQRTSEEGLAYAWDGNKAAGDLHVRFPMDIQPAPVSAQELLNRDLNIASGAKRPRKQTTKSFQPKVDLIPPVGIGVLVDGTRIKLDGAEQVHRTFYLTTAERKIVAVDCTLPNEIVANDDVCITFMRTLKLIPEKERQPRLIEQALRRRLIDASENSNIFCSQVLVENKEFRTLFPQAYLKEIPRFEFLYTTMQQHRRSVNHIQIAPIAESEALQILQQVEQACINNPSRSYFEVVKSQWPIKLGVLVNLTAK